MANLFSTMMDNFGNWFAQKVASFINDPNTQRYKILGNYYSGDQRPQLKRMPAGQDDNVIQNYVGLAVDRSVSRLYKGGMKFVLPEGREKQEQYLARLWDLNKREIILYQQGLYGATYGTCFFKICPEELMDPFTQDIYPRLLAIEQPIIRVKTAPDDANDVEEYRIEYQVLRDNQTVNYREITRQTKPENYVAGQTEQPVNETWTVEEWQQIGGGPWQLVSTTDWPYDFPPILHWKNLPSLNSVYGDSEIDDTINIQDKNNFVVSNTGKIIKYHAHPTTIGTGFSVDQMSQKETAVGTFTAIPSDKAQVRNLEMQSDLASSRQFAQDLRKSIFDIAREVDTSSLADKLGQLTNFAVRVLYTDALDKNDTKRQLYGDALLELNRRLLVLQGWQGEDTNPGTIQWGEAIIYNILEELQADALAIQMGVVDQETVARRYEFRYGVNWETIQERLQNQQLAANEQNANIGALLLRNFNQGGGETNITRNVNVNRPANNPAPTR